MKMRCGKTTLGRDNDIWKAAAVASAHVQRVDGVRRLTAARAALSDECGSCAKWITKDCPREGNLNGRKFGPAFDARVCSAFIEAHWVPEKRAKIDAELATLDGSAPTVTDET